MKKLTALLLLFSLVLTLLPGCAREEEAYVPTGNALYIEGQDMEEYLAVEEKIQDFALAYCPDRSMNPLIGYNHNNKVLFSLIYQGLFGVDNKNNVTPILCASYQVSPDSKTYTFYLESAACFSDGTKVTAEDVLATYQAAQAGGYYKGRFTHVNDIYLAGDGGIGFSLATGYQNFPLLLDIPIVKASQVDAENPLGTGPYVFTDSVQGKSLQRNVNWWTDREIPVNAPTIPLLQATDDAQIRDAFQFENVGLVCTNPLASSYAEYSCDYELWDVDNGVFLYLGLNLGFSDFFEEDNTLRDALTYAIDRATINEKFYRGRAFEATVAVSPGSPYYSASLAANYGYNTMTFIDKTSGWTPPRDKEKKEKKLRILVNSDDSARLRTARFIAEELTELGIPAGTLEYGSTGRTTYEQVILAGNYDMYLGQTRLSPNNDLSPFFGWGLLSRGGLTNQSIMDMCRQSLADTGNYYNLQQKIAEEAGIIPVLFGNYAVYAKRGLFEGLSPSRDNAFYYSLGKTMAGCKIPTVYD